jgi:hypothetical protein
MGVETKLFVTAKKEVMFDLMPKLIKDINEWQRAKLDAEAKNNGFSRMRFLFSISENIEVKKNWSNGISNVGTRDFNLFTINFRVNGERRRLSISHDCSCDHSDTYEGDKIIFSLGCYGISEEIMLVVAESVKGFGDVYYNPNDSTYDFKKI